MSYCADPKHKANCPGEVEHRIPPGSVFTYDSTFRNATTISTQLVGAIPLM